MEENKYSFNISHCMRVGYMNHIYSRMYWTAAPEDRHSFLLPVTFTKQETDLES